MTSLIIRDIIHIILMLLGMFSVIVFKSQVYILALLQHYLYEWVLVKYDYDIKWNMPIVV